MTAAKELMKRDEVPTLLAGFCEGVVTRTYM